MRCGVGGGALPGLSIPVRFGSTRSTEGFLLCACVAADGGGVHTYLCMCSTTARCRFVSDEFLQAGLSLQGGASRIVSEEEGMFDDGERQFHALAPRVVMGSSVLLDDGCSR